MKALLILIFLNLSTYAQDKPNILFIAVDDLKPILGCYGDNVAITPNIDSLAKQGVTFEKAYCQWPVCGGSRASLMTGLYPESTGIMDLKTKMRDVNPNLLTLPQHFANNGYTTTGVGKIYDPRCVDNKDDLDKPSWTIPFSKLQFKNMKDKNNKRFADAVDCRDEEMTDGQIAEKGVALLKKLGSKQKPFFLAVGFKKPHLPLIAPKKYWDLYKRNQFKIHKYQEKAKFATKYNWHDSNELRSYKEVPKTFDEAFQKETMHGYYACVSYIDAQVGKLLKQLKASKLEKNTIVIFWGDHGFHLGDHGMWGKHTNLEQASIVPLIIKVPGQKESTLINSTAGLIDIFPTLCEAANLSIPKVVQGKSLMPIIKGTKDKVRAGIITSFKNKGALGYSFRTERYRYIEWISNNGSLAGVDLYDYEKDPNEQENLAKKPEYKSLMKELANLLREEGKGARKLYSKQAKK
ncbi:MAG: sulfatase [Lentisphaeraceae bacterium]|nr:sulfatase [Lentisphaeraceae bacterium]